MTPFVVVKVPVQGLHHWPEPVSGVEFLGDQHRHTFTIRVKIYVAHGNRSTEFILFKGAIIKWLDENFVKYHGHMYQFKDLSCEQLSHKLATHLMSLGFHVDWVSFSEDEEFEGGVEVI